jgi:hypothetical protein
LRAGHGDTDHRSASQVPRVESTGQVLRTVLAGNVIGALIEPVPISVCQKRAVRLPCYIRCGSVQPPRERRTKAMPSVTAGPPTTARVSLATSPVAIVSNEPPLTWRDLGKREVWMYGELLYLLIWRDLKCCKQTLSGWRRWSCSRS